MKDIHDFQRRMDYMNGVKGEQAEKPKVREKLETDIAEFLASGGKITEVPISKLAKIIKLSGKISRGGVEIG